MRPTVHEIITSKIKAHAALVDPSRPCTEHAFFGAVTSLQLTMRKLEHYQLPKQKLQNGKSLAGTLWAVSPVSAMMAPTGKAQVAAKELLDSILDAVVRIFGTTFDYYFGTLLQCEI